MNILQNCISLSNFDMKQKNYQVAENRIRQVLSQKVNMNNCVLLTNLGVIRSIHIENNNKQVSNKQLSNRQKLTQPLQLLCKSLQSNPLSYISYYNCFILFLKQNKKSQALQFLTKCFSSLSLTICLKTHNQSFLHQLTSSSLLLSQSIHTYLIKAIIHVYYQKYILAIVDINKIIQFLLIINEQQQSQINKKNNKIGKIIKIKLFNVIRKIFQKLKEKDKVKEIDKEILKLNQYNFQQQQQDKQLQSNQGYKQQLKIVYQVPSDEKQINQQLSSKFQLFKQLIKAHELKHMKYNKNQPNIYIRQITSQQLTHNNNYTIDNLIIRLQQTLSKSPLFLKQQQLLEHIHPHYSVDQSKQQIFFNPIHSKDNTNNYNIKTKQQPSLSLSGSLSLNLPMIKLQQLRHPKHSGLQLKLKNANKTKQQQQKSSSTKRFSTTQWISPPKHTKSTQQIYPVRKLNQQVQIKLVMANLTNNKQMFGTMDPYCIIKYNKQKKNSTVIKNGGIEPRWKESFVFYLTKEPTQMEIQVWDKEKFKKDDFVGKGKFILDKNGFAKIQIYEKQKQAGIVFVNVQAKR